MRILILCLALGLPFATIASAQDGFDQRTVGIGADLDVASIGSSNNLLPRVDSVFLRWQVTPGVALEPSLGLIGETWVSDGRSFASSAYTGVGLGGRFRMAHHDDIALLLLASGNISRFAALTDVDQTGTGLEQRSLRADAAMGLGVEYAPKRHWAIGADYDVRVFRMSSTRLGDAPVGTSWVVGPASWANLDVHATLYF